jgi:hypothetical protein
MPANGDRSVPMPDARCLICLVESHIRRCVIGVAVSAVLAQSLVRSLRLFVWTFRNGQETKCCCFLCAISLRSRVCVVSVACFFEFAGNVHSSISCPRHDTAGARIRTALVRAALHRFAPARQRVKIDSIRATRSLLAHVGVSTPHVFLLRWRWRVVEQRHLDHCHPVDQLCAKHRCDNALAEHKRRFRIDEPSRSSVSRIIHVCNRVIRWTEQSTSVQQLPFRSLGHAHTAMRSRECDVKHCDDA